MRTLIAAATATLTSIALLPAATAQAPSEATNESTYARVEDGRLTVGNDLVERTWDLGAFGTTSLIDKRSADGVAAGAGADFRLFLSNATIDSTRFTSEDVTVAQTENGVRAAVRLTGPGIDASRTIEVFEGIAGFRTQTTLDLVAPLALRGYTLDEAAVGPSETTIHAFRAGADWREPDWGGPDFALGDAHEGTWRKTQTAPAGTDLVDAAQWVTSANDDHRLFMVMERNDWPSSRAGHEDGTTALTVDYARDVVILGPFEENAHVENPGDSDGRARVIGPGPHSLEAAFTGFGTDADDEAWQFFKYLDGVRTQPYDHEVTFNSNGTDDGVLSDGAKDDMDFATFMQVAPKAQSLGTELFIFDDGWQAISGDWFPDCPDHPEPRWDGDPDSRYKPRFPDCSFQAVREELTARDMELGLWMSPMHFHPKSRTYQSNPQWACAPIGHGTAALSIVDPDGGSNDAGLGTWGPDAIAHVESRIRNAIENWGVTYFKFDFLVWLDCVGQGDLYRYKEEFIAMLDRLIASYPHVTFQIDETNDYRLFPFESVSRGPSWFQNGSPSPQRLLHNLWNLSPYVPAYSLGQHFLGGTNWSSWSSLPEDEQRAAIETRMAVALPSHLTFFSDLREVPQSALDMARPWFDFYKAHRDAFTQMVYPLLDDPMSGGWTALQPWDPESGSGALLAFRQDAQNPTQTIALRNVPPGMTFDLLQAPTGEVVRRATSDELSNGIDVTIPRQQGAQVFVIVPAQQEEDRSTTLTYDGDTSGRVGAKIILAATLRRADGSPLPGRNVSFEFRGVTVTASTDQNGRATVVTRLLGPPGSYTVHVSFSGDGTYDPSATAATITASST